MLALLFLFSMSGFAGLVEEPTHRPCLGLPEDVTSYDGGILARAACRQAVRVGNYQVAVDFFTEHLRDNPADARAYAGRSYARQRAGDIVGALMDLDQAVSLEPGAKELHLNKGALHWLMSQYASAVTEYNMAIDLDPGYFVAHYYLAILYSRAVDDSFIRPGLAIVHATDALVHAPDRHPSARGFALTALADAHACGGDFERAVSILESATADASISRVTRQLMMSKIKNYRARYPLIRLPRRRLGESHGQR